MTYPLRRLYSNQFTIAPLSVLVDPVRASRIFGLRDGARFSAKVQYIYQKQLEEADIIVINKTDSTDPASVLALKETFQSRFPNAVTLAVSSRTGAGLEAWFDRLNSEQAQRKTIDIDYTRYAEGEALLGWLNATIRLEAARGHAFDPDHLLDEIAAVLQSHLSSRNAEIAHLKMTFSPDEGLGGLAVLNLVRNDFVPELARRIDGEVRSGQLLVNLRAEADPNMIQEALRDAVTRISGTFPKLTAEIEHLEHFRPGKPVPTHRVEVS